MSTRRYRNESKCIVFVNWERGNQRERRNHAFRCILNLNNDCNNCYATVSHRWCDFGENIWVHRQVIRNCCRFYVHCGQGAPFRIIFSWVLECLCQQTQTEGALKRDCAFYYDYFFLHSKQCTGGFLTFHFFSCFRIATKRAGIIIMIVSYQ